MYIMDCGFVPNLPNHLFIVFLEFRLILKLVVGLELVFRLGIGLSKNKRSFQFGSWKLVLARIWASRTGKMTLFDSHKSAWPHAGLNTLLKSMISSERLSSEFCKIVHVNNVFKSRSICICRL